MPGKKDKNTYVPDFRDKLHFIFDEMGGIDNQKSLAAKISVSQPTFSAWNNTNTLKSSHLTRLCDVLVVNRETLLLSSYEDFVCRVKGELSVGSGIRWDKWLAKYPCDNRVILKKDPKYSSDEVEGYRGLGVSPDRQGSRPSHFFINDRIRISVKRFRMPEDSYLEIKDVLFLVKDSLGWDVIPRDVQTRIDSVRASVECPVPEAQPLYVMGEAGPQRIVCLAVNQALPEGVSDALFKGKIALASDLWVNWLHANKVDFRIAHSRYHVSYGQRL